MQAQLAVEHLLLLARIATQVAGHLNRGRARVTRGSGRSRRRPRSADPHADTALCLRFHAAIVALHLGRWHEAARLVHGWPLAAMPGFLARSDPLFARLAHGMLQELR